MKVLWLRHEPIAFDENGGFWKGINEPDMERPLNAQASWGLGWDHVSVSVAGSQRVTPTWGEMEKMRRFFFEPTETVVQLHPPIDKYVSHTGPHMGVLHLWRKQGEEHALPPREFI